MARIGSPMDGQSAVVWFKGNVQKSRYWLFLGFLFCLLLSDTRGLEEWPSAELSALGAPFVTAKEHSSGDDISDEDGEARLPRGASLLQGLPRLPPEEHFVLRVQQPTSHGHQMRIRTKSEFRKRPYSTAFVSRTKRDGRRHRKRIPQRTPYEGNLHKNLPGGPHKNKRKARNQDAPSGRIQIAGNGSYISPSFKRNGRGVSSFRHYKDFQNDLKFSETDGKTSSPASSSPSLLLFPSSHLVNSEKTPNSGQGVENSASHDDFKFPDTIVKDGQIFYRHDGTEEILATISPTSTGTTTIGDENQYSAPQDPSQHTSESQMPRGFNILMDHVRQVGAGAPIISAAIAGASVRGSSKGSSSHVVGSAINGGYFAASAQGYDGKGGAIHSHVRGTSERVSGGASAIAPDQDGEAFIQVDHSEKGLSISQSSTHNGDAFVVADIDSESKRLFEHGDSTSSFSNTYKTKRFGHTLGEAKSNISPNKPRAEAGWKENIPDYIDNQDNNQQQRSIGIDMINNIMEQVHLPNARSLPSSRIAPNPRLEDNFLNPDTSFSRQENHSRFPTPSEEGTKTRNFLTGIDADYHIEESGLSTKVQKKGTVGVVTFPYDHEGLPPGPGELLDQSLPTHPSLLPSFNKIPQSSVPATLNHHPRIEDTAEEKYNNNNRLPLFTRDGLDHNNYPINSFGSPQYDFTNRNNFIEYQHPQVEERLSSTDTNNKNTNSNGNNHSNFADSNDLDYHNLRVDHSLQDPRNTEKDIPADYFGHALHDFNFTQLSRESGHFDDYLYDNSFFNHQRISLKNDTIEENNSSHLYPHGYETNQNFDDENYDDSKPLELPVASTPNLKNSGHRTNLGEKRVQDYNRDSLDYWAQNSDTNKRPYYHSSDHIPYYDVYDDRLTTRQPIDYELYNTLEAGKSASPGGDERENSVRDLKPTGVSHHLDSANKVPPDSIDLSEEREIIGEDKGYDLAHPYPSNFDHIPYHYPDVYDGQLTTKVPVDYESYNSLDDRNLATGRAYSAQDETGKVDFGSYPTVFFPHLDFTTKLPPDYSDLYDNTIESVTQAHTPIHVNTLAPGNDSPQPRNETVKVNFDSYPTVVSPHHDSTTRLPTDYPDFIDNRIYIATLPPTANRSDGSPIRGHDNTVTLTTTPRSEFLPDRFIPRNEIHRHGTPIPVSTDTPYPNYWRDQKEKWEDSPSETDTSFRTHIPVSTDTPHPNYWREPKEKWGDSPETETSFRTHIPVSTDNPHPNYWRDQKEKWEDSPSETDTSFRTHIPVSTDTPHPNYWRDQKEKWGDSPSETDTSFRTHIPVSTDTPHPNYWRDPKEKWGDSPETETSFRTHIPVSTDTPHPNYWRDQKEKWGDSPSETDTSFRTHIPVSTDTPHPNYWREQKEKWGDFPSETDASFRGPPSRHDNQHAKIIPAGRAGSSHLLEPQSPGHPYVRIISLDHSTPRHPQHMDGIMLEPRESIPGLPGYRMPPGFRGKIIFGKFVSTGNGNYRRSYDRDFPSYWDRQPSSRSIRNYTPGRSSTYRYQSKPRDSRILNSARNNYARKPGRSNRSRIICRDHPDCDSRRGSRNKDELCDFSPNGIVCCC